MTLRPHGRTPGGKQRWACRTHTRGSDMACYQTTNPDAPLRTKGAFQEQKRPQQVIPKRKLGGNVFVITWAQNATPVNEPFFKALLAYCDHNSAELVVIPGRYKNPTSRWSSSQANDEIWAPELVPYLFNQRRALNKNLHLIGDIKIQPTATSPLTGFEGITHAESGIFGHPKLQLKTVPTPQNALPKILTTTGAVTRANYTDTRVGKTGEFHHIAGAVVVEVESAKVFHLRHINYSTRHQGFIDLGRAYYADGRVHAAPPAEAVIFGDAHWRFADPVVVAATFDQLLPELRPKQLVWHDLMDSYAVSPHHAGNPFVLYAKHKAGFNNVRDEVQSTITWMLQKGKGYHNIIIPSNHDDMLRRWVVREDWKEDPVNAEFYLETALAMLRSTRMGDTGAETLDPFQRLVEAREADNVQCVPLNGSYVIAGIECALHGDKGPNGVRGSIKNLRRIGPKVVIGHSHSPGIDEGAYQIGTMTRLKAEYTGPVGSWLNTHCSIDGFGKRHLHTCIKGAFFMRR